MSSFRIISGGRGVDVPIVHRDLKDAKCNCEMIKSPIGFHSVFTFNCFNQQKIMSLIRFTNCILSVSILLTMITL